MNFDFEVVLQLVLHFRMSLSRCIVSRLFLFAKSSFSQRFWSDIWARRVFFSRLESFAKCFFTLLASSKWRIWASMGFMLAWLRELFMIFFSLILSSCLKGRKELTWIGSRLFEVRDYLDRIEYLHFAADLVFSLLFAVVIFVDGLNWIAETSLVIAPEFAQGFCIQFFELSFEESLMLLVARERLCVTLTLFCCACCWRKQDLWNFSWTLIWCFRLSLEDHAGKNWGKNRCSWLSCFHASLFLQCSYLFLCQVLQDQNRKLRACLCGSWTY